MNRLLRAAPATATAFVLLACGSGSASEPDSGIRGHAMLSPTCPVEQLPPAPGCEPRPFATTILVLRASDRERVARTRSGTDGRFHARVRPGRYYVTGSSTGTLPRARTVLVTVRRHAFTYVTITFDSGIR
jgi:hypothetical protein